MNASFYRKWALISEKLEVLKNYFKKWSLIDLIPLLFLYISIYHCEINNKINENVKMLSIIFFFKI